MDITLGIPDSAVPALTRALDDETVQDFFARIVSERVNSYLRSDAATQAAAAVVLPPIVVGGVSAKQAALQATRRVLVGQLAAEIDADAKAEIQLQIDGIDAELAALT